MTLSSTLHKTVINSLKSKMLPGESLTEKLSEVLSINKHAVYRRLEGKVSFSFEEMALISHRMRISLDELIGGVHTNSQIYSLRKINHFSPSEDDIKTIKNYIEFIKWFKHSPNSIIEGINNMIPETLYVPYESIIRFFMLKWVYQYGSANLSTFYKDIHIDPEYRKLQLEFYGEAHMISSTSLVFDYLIFYYIINDIKYFFNLRLITSKELLVIQKDFYSLLDNLEWSCKNGVFKDTNKKLNIYISDINFDTNYYYAEMNELKLSLVKTFLMNDLVNTEEKTFEQFKNWIQSLKRYSTLITLSAEKERIFFFENQRILVESLTNKNIDTEEILLRRR